MAFTSKKVKMPVYFVLLLCLLFLLILVPFLVVEPYMKVTLNGRSGARDYYQIDLAPKQSGFEGGICSSPLLLRDPYYKELMDSYLHVWYKFVPHQSKMDSSNCWYAENLDVLPTNLTNRMREFHSFKFIEKQFTVANVETILGKGFQNLSVAASASPTSHYFCLPSTYLIGFPKTGSTYFYSHHLAPHPLFAEPRNKEGLFWREMMTINHAKYRELAVLLYLYHFFDASNQIKENPDMFTIDASVSTVFATPKPLRQPEIDVCIVPLLLYKALPKMKLMAIMRDPTERLWSDFLFFCPPHKWDEIKGLAKTPFVVASVFHNQTVVALQKFVTCIESGHTEIHCAALTGSYPGRMVSCEEVRIGLGLYYVHLIKWFNVFPQEQLHMMRLEDLALDPSSTMDRVWKFLDRPLEGEVKAVKTRVRANDWHAMDSGTGFKMFPETRKLIEDFYHPYNARLADLLHDKRYLWAD